MQPVILEHLKALYGPTKANSIYHRLTNLLRQFRSRAGSPAHRPLSERDAVLITYADQIRAPGVSPLRALAEFGRRWWKDLVTTVHILPFYPYSSDDGFAVKDFYAVDPALGDWSDVSILASDCELMFDAVFNHMSAQSDWFGRFRAGDPAYHDYFVTVEGQADLSEVIRPRALPLLTEFTTARGIERVWTTFSADQVDLNLKNPEVLLRIIDVLLFYVAHEARWIRLDAIAYLWKEPGTPCIHLPQTHRIIQLLRGILEEVAPGVRLITETNVPHADNISYFGDGTNEAQLVYNFALPPLVLHTFRSGDATALVRWGRELALPSTQVAFFNFLASHDGIGLNPARGLLAPADIDALVARTIRHGGWVSQKSDRDGAQSPYELNINYFDALSAPSAHEPLDRQAARFLAAHSILLTWQGVPGIYVHSLLGSRGDRVGAEQSGIPRRINRQKLDGHELERELNRADSLRARVFEGMTRMLRARQGHPGFKPSTPQAVWSPDPRVLMVRRGHPGSPETVWSWHNVSDQEVRLPGVLQSSGGPGTLRDLLDGQEHATGEPLLLQPYQALWLAG